MLVGISGRYQIDWGKKMRVALDAMGSDNNPIPDVEGGVLAARESGSTLLFVGDEQAIRSELKKHKTTGLNLEIVPASQAITMTDIPSIAAKEKGDSSMHVGMRLVKDGLADAFMTAGNTGVAYATAMLYTLKRIPGVKRPALSVIFKIANQPVIFLDMGANADSKAEWLVQFAIMGQIYAEKSLGLSNPRVGLLSNGEEAEKGTQAVRDAGEILQHLSINFVGNVEPKEVLSGRADVVVSDGFTGNILLKTFEASTRYLSRIIRDEITGGVFSSLGGLLIRPAMKRVKKKIDTDEIGGAPLLGVDGVVIIGHGSSDAYAVKNAIHQAHCAVQGKIIEAIRDGLQKAANEENVIALQAGGII
jgi:glycerol-3-phosphate acyltransferase PlsX